MHPRLINGKLVLPCSYYELNNQLFIDPIPDIGAALLLTLLITRGGLS